MRHSGKGQSAGSASPGSAGRDLRTTAPAEEWESLAHRLVVDGHTGYLTVATDGDGRPVHLEIRISKARAVLRGLLDALAVSVSLGLWNGVPLAAYVEQLALVRFEAAGWTPGELSYAHSISDHVFRWLALKFPGRGAVEPPVEVPNRKSARSAAGLPLKAPASRARTTATTAFRRYWWDPLDSRPYLRHSGV